MSEETNHPEEQIELVEFVFMGERMTWKDNSPTGKMSSRIRLIDSGQEMFFSQLKGYGAGNVYLGSFTKQRGSLFTSGAKMPKYVRRWEDAGDIALWQATEFNERMDLRKLKEEKSDRRLELRHMLQPIVDAIAKTDRYGKRCIMLMVEEILSNVQPGKSTL